MSNAKATAVAPALAEGSTAPLSCDLAGNLRTSGGVAVIVGANTPSDGGANPTQNVAVTGFNELFCPENTTADTWLRARGDKSGNSRSIASAPPADGASAGCASFYQSIGSIRDSVKASAGRLLAFHWSGLPTTAGRFLMFFNGSVSPNNGDTPILTIALATTFMVVNLERPYFGETGRPMTLGIAWAISTTSPTLTTPATQAGSTMNISYA